MHRANGRLSLFIVGSRALAGVLRRKLLSIYCYDHGQSCEIWLGDAAGVHIMIQSYNSINLCRISSLLFVFFIYFYLIEPLHDEGLVTFVCFTAILDLWGLIQINNNNNNNRITLGDLFLRDRCSIGARCACYRTVFLLLFACCCVSH